jgi:hypothetical protein
MLPASIGEPLNPLAQFSHDPVSCIGEDEDAWEKFNGSLDMVLQSNQKNYGSWLESVIRD